MPRPNDDLDLEMDDEMMGEEDGMELEDDMPMDDEMMMDDQGDTPIASTPEDPFTPPEEGMIPVSWAFPGDTAVGETMETGDASLAMEGEDGELDPLSAEEEQVIVEYRKWKKARVKEGKWGYPDSEAMSDTEDLDPPYGDEVTEEELMYADDDLEFEESAEQHMNHKAGKMPGDRPAKGSKGSRSAGTKGRNMTMGYSSAERDTNGLKKKAGKMAGDKPARRKAEAKSMTDEELRQSIKEAIRKRRLRARVRERIAALRKGTPKKKTREGMSVDLEDDAVTIRYPRGSQPVGPTSSAVDAMGYDEDFDETDLVESVRERASRRRKLLAAMKRRSAELQFQEETGADTPAISDDEVEKALEDLHNSVMEIGGRREAVTESAKKKTSAVIKESVKKDSGPASRFVERYQRKQALDFKKMLKDGILG